MKTIQKNEQAAALLGIADWKTSLQWVRADGGLFEYRFDRRTDTRQTTDTIAHKLIEAGKDANCIVGIASATYEATSVGKPDNRGIIVIRFTLEQKDAPVSTDVAIQTCDVAVDSRGPNPIGLMKVLRNIAGDLGKYATIPGSLKDAKEFVEGLRTGTQAKVFLRGVGLGVAEDVGKQIQKAGGSVRIVLPGALDDAPVDAQAEEKSEGQRQGFTEFQFLSHLAELTGLYIEEANDNDPDWLHDLETLEKGALDFALFIDALGGAATELCAHGRPKTRRCERCVDEGIYTYAQPTTTGLQTISQALSPMLDPMTRAIHQLFKDHVCGEPIPQPKVIRAALVKSLAENNS